MISLLNTSTKKISKDLYVFCISFMCTQFNDLDFAKIIISIDRAYLINIQLMNKDHLYYLKEFLELFFYLANVVTVLIMD